MNGPDFSRPVTHAGNYSASETSEYCTLALQGFESLKYAASILAGTLILAYTGANRSFQDIGFAHKALDELERAEEIIRSIRVPVRSRHHHLHLTNALGAIRGVAEKLGRARISGQPREMDAIVAELGRGWEELRHASRNVPGFEMVDLSQSCCALHSRRLRGLGA